MNIFEGARRIAVVAAWVIIFVSAFAIYGDSPNVLIPYRVMYFGAPPIKIGICDDVVDATRYKKYVTENGREFSIKTCFRASRADNGQVLIPYAEAPNDMVYMGRVYSDEVQRYTEGISETITPTSSDLKEADSEYTRQAWVKRLKDVALLAGGLFLYWIIVWTIGWIIRGFLGIPRGQDYRVMPAQP